MPEGPECRNMAVKLHSRLANNFLLKITPTDQQATRQLVDMTEIINLLPLRVIGVSCKGKRIVFILSSVKNNQVCFFTSFLSMEGRWLFQQAKYTRLIMTFSNDLLIYYDDMRRWGKITGYTDANKLQQVLDQMGPDVLAYSIELYNPEVKEFVVKDKLTIERWSSILNHRLGQKKQLADFLMHQEYICGIGNYLKSEILYRAKLRPDRLVSSLTNTEREILWQVSLDTIYQSFLAGGLTLRSYLDPEGNRGTFKHLVYGLKIDSNGYRILTSKFKDGRTTFWVPEIQI